MARQRQPIPVLPALLDALEVLVGNGAHGHAFAVYSDVAALLVGRKVQAFQGPFTDGDVPRIVRLQRNGVFLACACGRRMQAHMASRKSFFFIRISFIVLPCLGRASSGPPLAERHPVCGGAAHLFRSLMMTKIRISAERGLPAASQMAALGAEKSICRAFTCPNPPVFVIFALSKKPLYHE